MKSSQARDAQGMNDGQVRAPALPLEKKKNITYKASRHWKSVNVKVVCRNENSGFGIRKRTLQLIATPAVQSLA